MESESLDNEISTTATTPTRVWKLKRYGRFLPHGKVKASGRGCAWKIFDSSDSAEKLELNILDSAHLLVSQGQELLEGFSLLNSQSFLKVQHKSDSLLFNITVKGESRLIRLQFDGSSRAEAADFCAEAVERLKDHVRVQEHMTTRSSAAKSTPEQPGPSPQEPQTPQDDEPQAAPDLSMESLSIKQLSQYFLGESKMSLPVAYHQSTLPPGDMEQLLRLCLLDSSFPSFVEEVEKKLREIVQE
ncbi:meiotic recombination protein REC114 [Triplophysa rosa]|uniref:Meiotic recombination protein n=1 Tax=Triplophysa rosa TaxID=992332 RepID=A0A9W7TTQ8_TRIRA|nr:meiotic recombination protein REC114 [Triplophysa rosa]KAI7802616.1 putative meiotic recombination protein [Triplophysa rosa]